MSQNIYIGTVDKTLPSGKIIEIRDFVLDDLNLRLTQNEVEYWSQKIENTLKVNLGEYYLDPSIGVPYWGPNGQVLKKTADLNEIQDLLIIEIVNIEGINNVEKFEPVYNQETRTYNVNIRTMTDSGVIVEGEIRV